LRDRTVPKIKVTPIGKFSVSIELLNTDFSALRLTYLDYLDDEPEAGPDTYIIIMNLLPFAFLESTVKTTVFPISNVICCSEIPNAGDNLASNRGANILSKYPFSETVFTTIPCKDHADVHALFTAIAKLCYNIQATLPKYTEYFSKQRVISIPEASSSLNSHVLANDASEEGMFLKDLLDKVSYLPSPANDIKNLVNVYVTLFFFHELILIHLTHLSGPTGNCHRNKQKVK
jgi:hypothetical protein